MCQPICGHVVLAWVFGPSLDEIERSIPAGTWMWGVLSGRSLCDELIPRPEVSY